MHPRFAILGLLLALGGFAPARAQQVYIGQIMWTGASFCPIGWLPATGSLLSISDFDAVFALIGTTYGGDGQQTFALPDLRGRMPVHVGSSASGNVAQGEIFGAESATMSVAQMPSHSHAATTSLTARASNAAGDTSAPMGNVLAASGTARVYATGSSNVDMDETSINASTTVQPAGGNQPMPILQPFLALTPCMTVEGVFPSRN